VEALGLAHTVAAKPHDAVVATKRLAWLGVTEGVLPRFEQELEAINWLLAGRRSPTMPEAAAGTA